MEEGKAAVGRVWEGVAMDLGAVVREAEAQLAVVVMDLVEGVKVGDSTQCTCHRLHPPASRSLALQGTYNRVEQTCTQRPSGFEGHQAEQL